MFTNRLFNLLPMLALLMVSACAPATTKLSTPFQQWHTANVLQAFDAAGLQIEIPKLSKDERDGFSMVMPVESKPFIIPAQGDPALARGIIFSFQSEDDLKMMRDYYESLGKSLPEYSSWVFVKDNLLLQVNSNVPEAVAKQYAAALNLLEE